MILLPDDITVSSGFFILNFTEEKGAVNSRAAPARLGRHTA